MYLNGKRIYKLDDWEEVIPSLRNSENDIVQKWGGGTTAYNTIHTGTTLFEIKQVKYFEEPLDFIHVNHHYLTSIKPNYSITECSDDCVDTIIGLITPTPTITPSVTPTPTVTIGLTPTMTGSVTPTPTTTTTPSVTPTITVSPSITPTISLSPSVTPTITVTSSVTPTVTLTPSVTASITPTSTVTPTNTVTPTSTVTPTNTVTPTVTETPTPTPTVTSSETPTPTPTNTTTPTPTITYYYYYLLNCNLGDNKYGRSTNPSLSGNIFNVNTNTCYTVVGNDPGPSYDYDLDIASMVVDCTDILCGPTPTPTNTVTPTETPTNTPTPTETPTNTPTPTVTPTPTPTPAVPVTTNLVLYYDPSNSSSYPGTGTTINDLSGNGLNGSMSGITFTTPYFTYNGTSSQIAIADNALLEPGSGDWTMEVWVNQSVAGNDVVLGKFPAGGAQVSYSIRTSATVYYAQMGSGIGSGATLFQSSSNQIRTIGTWYQLVYVFTNVASNTIETFVNGVSIGTVSHSLASILNSTNPLYIGSYNGGEYTQWFDGKIGITRLYDASLTASQVLQNFDADKSKYGL